MSAAKQALSRVVRVLFSRFGLLVTIDRPVRNPMKLLALKASDLGVNTILDVGANRGQFSNKLRAAGYRGTIVSFEPLSAAHHVLRERAKEDRDWIVAPRMALGSRTEETQINVSENLDSSSLLAVGKRSVNAAPETHYVGSESVTVRRLDDVVQPEWRPPFAFKLDTQGFELEVLKGAGRLLNDTVLITTELSLTPLYDGGAPMAEVFRYLEEHGFRCIGLSEGFIDTARNELLQVDGIFVRDA